MRRLFALFFEICDFFFFFFATIFQKQTSNDLCELFYGLSFDTQFFVQ